MSSHTPGGPVLGHTGLGFLTVESCESKQCERPRKGGVGVGSQILFKPFVIYTGIYLSLKNKGGMCGTIRSVTGEKLSKQEENHHHVPVLQTS